MSLAPLGPLPLRGLPQPAKPPPGVVAIAPDPLLRRWRSIEQLREGFKAFGFHVDPLRLEGGPFGGQSLAVPIAPLRLLRFQVRGRLHSLGQKPRGVLAVSVDLDPRLDQAPWRSHGEELPLNCLFGQDANRDIHLTLPARVSIGMVIFPLAALEAWAAQLGWPGFDGDLLPRQNVHLLDPASADGLRRFLRRVFAIAERAPARLRHPSSQRLIREDLIPLLLEALITGPAVTRRPPARIDLVKEVQQWMHAHPTEPITLAELCRQAHASRRTLIQGFHDHLGMGPMAYLKILRLHGIRQRLLRADPSHLQIGPLADAWGFHNPGHFAAHYGQLFGERPSDTLRRAA